MRVLARVTIAAFALLAFAAPAAAQSERQFDIRGQIGGIFCCSEAGLVLGGGIGTRPFNNQQVEIAADVSFLRWAGSNGLYFSGNGLYHFNTSEPNFSPFAGAGLGILNIFDTRYFPNTLTNYNNTAGIDTANQNPLELQVAPGRTFKVGAKVTF